MTDTIVISVHEFIIILQKSQEKPIHSWVKSKLTSLGHFRPLPIFKI